MLLMGTVSFFDLEIDPTKNLILDVGCIRWDGTAFHETSVHKFIEFIKDSVRYLFHVLPQQPNKKLLRIYATISKTSWILNLKSSERMLHEPTFNTKYLTRMEKKKNMLKQEDY